MPPRERVNALRNGYASRGKVILKPESFESLLELCSSKLKQPGEESFSASRLFTQEGFEIDDIDAVFDGDVIVASAGEEYVDPSALPSHSALSSCKADEISRASSSGSSVTTTSLSSACPISSVGSSRSSFSLQPFLPIPVQASAASSSSSEAQPQHAERLASLSSAAPAPALEVASPGLTEPYTHLTVLQAAPLTSHEEV